MLGRGSRTALMILTKVLVTLKFKRFGYTNALAEPRSFVCHVGMGPWGRCFSKNLETCDTLDPRLGTAHWCSVGLGFINVSSFVKSLGSSGSLALPITFHGSDRISLASEAALHDYLLVIKGRFVEKRLVLGRDQQSPSIP